MALDPVHTTTTAGAFSPILYARAGLEVMKKSKVAAKTFMDVSGEYSGQGRGKSVTFAKRGKYVTTAAVAGDMGTLQAPTAGEATITLNQWREVKIFIPKDLKAKSRDDFIRQQIDGAVDAIADYFDNYLLGLYAQYEADAIACTDKTGADLYNLLKGGRKVLNKADVPGSGRVWIIDPELEDRMPAANPSGVYIVSQGTPADSGDTPRKFGATVNMTTNVPNEEAGSGSTLYHNFYGHPMAIAYIVAFNDFIEKEMEELNGTLLKADILFGATVQYPEAAVDVTCTD